MKKQIIINASKDRSRIAIVEDGELVELYVENPDNVRTLGNIYLGSVQKVMPAIRAAFVDVGQKQDCFLHFSDLTDNFPQLLSMTGVEVPGLDQPMLSLAPKKQVSDDDSEPDIEDKLEVEPDDDSDDDARSRPARGRRSRGRGRGHRHSEEEEEQEEAGEERPRRLPMVIDLTAKPRRPAPPPAPAPVVEAEEAAEEEEEAPTETAPAAPRTRGRRTRPAPEEAPEEAASTDAEPADAPDADAPDADVPEAEAPAPERPRRSRSRRAAAEEPVAEATEEPVAETAEEPAPPARRSRSRRAAAEADAPETTPDAEATPDKEAPAPARRSRSRRTTAETPAAEAAAETPAAETTDAASTAESAAEDAPDAQAEERPRRSRSRRTRETADETPAADAAPEVVPGDAGDGPEVTSPEAAEAESDDADTPRRPRRRRGGRGRGRRTDDAEDGADAGDTPASSADTAESPAEEARPRRSRGGRGRGAAETDAAPEPASEAAAETDEAPARSRRRSRADASDAPAEPTRGRGRSARTDSETEAAPRESRATNDRGSSASGTRSQGSVPSNEQLLKRGTPVIVKITKEPISTKGSRASTDLSIAGRFLVLVPAADYVAVSKKIESAKERRRLRTLASSLKPEGFGVIVRTVAEGRDTKSLDTDMRLLVEKWRKIERKLAERPKPPVLLYEDVNMVSSIIRDLFSEDYDQIIVDDPRVFKNVQTYVRAIAPQMADNVRLHTSSTPVFRALALERQVEEAFSKRVNMKGGGYLYIETTEAMHVVDVNSGRAGRGKSQKDNLIAVNVEAAKEIAKQLRLRDLGGIIVVDFIDLRHESDRRKVTNALKEAFAKDRAVTKLLPMSDFGLVQITRQRLRPSITTAGQGEDGAADPAEAARLAGAAEIEQPERGYAVEAVAEPAAERAAAPERATDVARASTPEALTAQLRAWLDTYRKNVDAAYKDRPVVVRVHPLFAAFLRRGFPSPLTRWRLTLRGITYRIEEDAAADPLAFDVRDEKSGRTLMKKYVA